MKEYFPHRFQNADGMAVMILESEYGNFHVREKAVMGDGRASWFMRAILGTLAEAVEYCANHFYTPVPEEYSATGCLPNPEVCGPAPCASPAEKPDAAGSVSTALLGALEAVAKKHGAVVGRYLRCGSKVEGLALAGRPMRADGWNASRRHPGYYTPGKSKLGKTIKAELDAIDLPTTEQLAIDLGCEPFFRDFDDGGMYCANISIFQYAGTFYLQSCKWCRPRLGMDEGYGIRVIEASEWHKADEDRLRLERGPAPNPEVSGPPSGGSTAPRCWTASSDSKQNPDGTYSDAESM